MQELTQERIAKVRKEFEYFDSDSSGHLDIKEFRELFRVIAPEAGRSESDEAFKAIDEDGSEAIEFDEFLAWWETNWSVY
ncbi:MAG: EF-hand domain-containing protein [Lysobacterales bacterium]